MEEEYLKKTYEEVASLKDLFIRRLMDDKVKASAIMQLKENNESLQHMLDQKAVAALVKDILILCDRIDAQQSADDMTASVKEELLDILARREFCPMPPAEVFDPAFHNAVGTVEESDEHPDKSIVKVVKNGYLLHGTVFRPADVIVAVKKKESKTAE